MTSASSARPPGSEVALGALHGSLVTPDPVWRRRRDVLNRGAAADDALARRRAGRERPAGLPAAHAVVAAHHQRVLLLGGAGQAGGGGDVGEVGQLGHVGHHAAVLGVGGLAVGVAVLLLNVPPQLPAFPFLLNLRLHLGAARVARWMEGENERRKGEECSMRQLFSWELYVVSGTCRGERIPARTSVLTKQYKMATSNPC